MSVLIVIGRKMIETEYFRGMLAETGRQVAVVLYVVAMVAIIVGVDLMFFRNQFWARLTVSIGIVLVFVAFYWTLMRDVGGDAVAYFLSIIALPFLHKYFLNLGEGNKVWTVWLMKISVLAAYPSIPQVTTLRFPPPGCGRTRRAPRVTPKSWC